MKKNLSKSVLCLSLLFASVISDCFAESGIYVGGHFRRNRPTTITTLKESGFTYVILFNVNVEEDGTLTTDGDTICYNGSYVFDKKHPTYVSDVNSLKEGKTCINRVEMCIGGWGNNSYNNIKKLVESGGTGENTMLYKNFAALKATIPSVDAFNNDDESAYDVNSATAFHIMLYDIGYKTTLAPYRNKTYWQSLATNINNQRNDAVIRVYIQCYDGGAGNNPSDWHLNNITLHAGRLNYQDFEESKTVMKSWSENNGVTGGFFWVYNDETWDLSKYAMAVNRIFSSEKIIAPVATIYPNSNYGGDGVKLTEREYTTTDLKLAGMPDNAISSQKVLTGFQMTAYLDDDFSGNSRVLSGNAAGLIWDNQVSSLKMEAKGISDLNGTYKIKAKNSNMYMAVEGDPVAGLTLVQKGVGTDFDLVEIKNGIYNIFDRSSNTVLGIALGSYLDQANTVMEPINSESKSQQIILAKDRNDDLQLIARHSAKAIEIPEGSTTEGDTLRQNTNNSQAGSLWILENQSSITQNKANDISLYPNPASDFIYINVDKDASISLFDMCGHILFSKQLITGTNNIDIRQLAVGQYLVKVMKENAVKQYIVIKK
ncbi:MAG: T9SS type A sorting domain-containing protein [Dysgonomonas sp.]